MILKIIFSRIIYADSRILSNFTLSDKYGLISMKSIIMINYSLYIARMDPYSKKIIIFSLISSKTFIIYELLSGI